MRGAEISFQEVQCSSLQSFGSSVSRTIKKMKKPNRPTKQTSVVDSSSSAVEDKELHEKRVHELELQNDRLKREVEDLGYKLANVSSPVVCSEKLVEVHLQKINALEEQVLDLEKKLQVQAQLSMRKPKVGETAKSFQDEIQRLRAKKVQLQCQAKLDSVQFRLSKASMQKEILQLKKQNRRIEFERHLLLALNQRQKLVLQRKNKEVLIATKRLKEFLESRKALTCRTAGGRKGSHSQFQSIEHEHDVTVQVQQVCSEYKREMEEMADVIEKLKLEAETLKEENSSCLRCQLEDYMVDLTVKDSELADLKEEVTRLSSIVGQMAAPNTEVIHHETQVDVIQSSASVGNSINLLDMNTSELELSAGVIDANRVCCSCSKKSLCKTSKCGCRAAGGSCGASCGCEASKCTNRESGILETEKSSDSASQDRMLPQNSPIEPEVKDICDLRQPLQEIGNGQKNFCKAGKRKKGRKPVTAPDSSNNSRNAGKIA